MQIEAKEEIWPLKNVFRISRGSRTEARVVVVTVTDGQHTGRGEAVPIGRYNQSVKSVLEQIESIKAAKHLDRPRIQELLPADADQVLETLEHPIPICADESCHTRADLPRLRDRYEVVNVKLDKTGGLTEALELCGRARGLGFKLLIGCMVGTSLSMAPARILVGAADYVDLDGPLLLARDREHGLAYQNNRIGVPSKELWG